LVTGSFWEQVVQSSIGLLFLSWLPIRDLEDPKKDFALANGPFVMLTRTSYDAIGGHDALKAEIAEDFVMAHRLKRAGFRLTYWDGTNYARLRMYETFTALWQGWTKNFYFGVGQSYLVALVFIAFILGYFIIPPVVAMGLPFVWLGAWGAGCDYATLTAYPWLAWLLCLLTVLCQRVARQLFALFYRFDPRLQIMEPVGFGLVIALLLGSFYQYKVKGSVTWRGRSHSTGT